MTSGQSSCADRAALGLQVGGAIVAMLAVGLLPPAHGTMLLVPIARDAPAVALALASGATLVSSGARGAVVVRGRRAALVWPLLRAGVVTVAAPSAACGSGVRR